MRVRCLKLEKTTDKKWLTEGQEYIVLTILMDDEKKIMYRLIGDDRQTPAVYDSQLFAITSTDIPDNWVVSIQNGFLWLTPQPWTESDFWDKYFDGEKKAVKIFEEERTKILAAEKQTFWDVNNTLEESKVWDNDLFLWLTEWHKNHCRGWEQGSGIQIGNLETPGWFLKINLKKTAFENKRFDVVDLEISATDWVFCTLNNGLFEGFCGPENLTKLLAIFRNWVEYKP